MFGNPFIAEIIARIFQTADTEVRRELIDPYNPLETNERDRVSVLCRLIRQEVNKYPFIRSFSIQAHARDTTRRDALFVFRFNEEVKIGLVEAKLLRISGANLNSFWDWPIGGPSHFTRQVIDQQLWLNQAAVWDMFIPNCNIGEHSPPFDREGSSNIWADELINNPKITRPNELWNYQDVLDAKHQYLSLYDIVKEIIKCNKGFKHNITGKNEIEIESSNPNIKMPIPIPRSQRLNGEIIESFFSNNKSIDSLNYYRFDDLYTATKDFLQKKELNIPNYLRDRNLLDKSFEEFLSIVNEAALNNN
ncbi:hypothetical protein [Flavobacterium sp. N1994]|uniref:hypothetical protein n=1 Tax=Flavobacterium sp. N1994 TaxID=2986827 RepID=UPI0022232FB8|nr:hypothetical protein [Flavobacterium sp. N1994]